MPLIAADELSLLPIRRFARILGLVTVVIVVAAVCSVVFVRSTARPVRSLFVPAILGAQPPAAVVLAGEDRELAVALAVQPKARHLLLVATILGQDGRGATGLTVSFRLHTADDTPVRIRAAAGTAGYYTAETTAHSPPTRVDVTVAGPGAGKRPLSFVLPARWPPAPAARLVSGAEQAYAQLRTLVTHERIASDPVHHLTSIYLARAPNSLRVTSDNGSEAILIGKQRWDRVDGRPWRHSTQTAPVRAIRPFWVGHPQDASVLGGATVRGHNAWIVSFAAPQMPAFFTLWIDKKTGRTLQLRMTAAAHFMRHVYGPFNTAQRIRAPGGQ